MARPTKYTPETAKKIIDAVRLGATYELACNYANISLDTLSRWRKRSADFADNLREAEGMGAIGWLAKIEKAAQDGDWKAAAWKLERRYPDVYGRQVLDQRHSGQIETPIEVRFFAYDTAVAQLTDGSESYLETPLDHESVIDGETVG